MTPPTPPHAPRRPHVLTEPRRRARRRLVLAARPRRPRRCSRTSKPRTRTPTPMLAPSPTLRDRIFDEIRARVQETDESAPVPDGAVGVLRAHRRRAAVRDPLPAAARRAAPSEQVAARRERARRRPRLLRARRLRGLARPPHRSRTRSTSTAASATRCASATSTTGADLADVVDDVTYGLAWADDARTCFYVRPDDAMRPYEVWRHRLGTPRRRRRARVPEDDERFFVGVGRTRTRPVRAHRDRRRRLTSEAWFVPTDAPERRAAGSSRRASTGTSTRSSTTATTRTATGSSSSPTQAARATSSSSPRRSPIPAARTGPSSSPHRDDVRLDARRRVRAITSC